MKRSRIATALASTAVLIAPLFPIALVDARSTTRTSELTGVFGGGTYTATQVGGELYVTTLSLTRHCPRK